MAAGGGSPGLGAGGTVSAHAAHSPGAPSCRPLCPPSAPSTCSAPFVPGTVAMALLAAPVAPWKPPGRGKVSARDARPRARPRALDADGSCRPSRSWKLGVAREAPAKRFGCVMPADGALLASPPPRSEQAQRRPGAVPGEPRRRREPAQGQRVRSVFTGPPPPPRPARLCGGGAGDPAWSPQECGQSRTITRGAERGFPGCGSGEEPPSLQGAGPRNPFGPAWKRPDGLAPVARGNRGPGAH